MQGLMMNYQLTIDRILEHGHRLYPHKKIWTKLPNGSFHSYTFADFYGRVKRLSNVLESLGVTVGDRVGTFAWNNYQHLEMYYGIPGVGAVCHTLNIRLSPEQLVDRMLAYPSGKVHRCALKKSGASLTNWNCFLDRTAIG